MARINNFETPLLRVSRPVSACQRCRSAKVKCDGQLPACTACERAGRTDCSSANDQFARGKERSYVASLETRVERLERDIVQAKARRATVNTVAVQSFLTPPIASAGGGGKGRRKEAQDVNDLVSDFGFLSVNATARDFHGFTEQMSFARLVLSTSSEEDMPLFVANILPQRHAVAPLMKLYLTNIHTLYPFLSETKIFAAIDAVFQGRGRDANPMDHWTTRMVLAIALASKSRKRGDTHYQDAVRHAAGALEHVEIVVQPGSIAGIQAMLLLVLYAELDPHHFNSWYLIGLASRAMVDIGLHQDPPKESRLGGPELEIRRRVYASIYSLDRSISMVYRRGFSFTDDSAGVTSSLLPPRGNASLEGQQVFVGSIEPAEKLYHLRQIQSSAYQKLFQASRPSLEDNMWRYMSNALCSMRRWSDESSGQIKRSIKDMFLSDILYSGVLIMSPPDLAATLCEYGKFVIFEYAAEYADLMASISSDGEGLAFPTYHDLLRASFVAKRLQLILCSDTTLLFSGVLPKAPLDSYLATESLAIPARTIGEMLDKAFRSLSQMEKVLEYLCPKYGYPGPLSEFKAQSSIMRQTLQVIYDNWNGNWASAKGLFVSPGNSTNAVRH